MKINIIYRYIDMNKYIGISICSKRLVVIKIDALYLRIYIFTHPYPRVCIFYK